ncbi:MAG: PQQ-binding-like beta-propeller repeat protein [Verrucomicrobiota bacterium]
MHRRILAKLPLCLFLSFILPNFSFAEPQWYSWRGPNQNGTSTEKYSSWSFSEEPTWTYSSQGRGTPVVVDGRLYSFGYRGEGADFAELLTCLDAKTGEKIWEHEISDYISDTIYSRYGIGAPTVDKETGNIYLGTTNGHFICVDRDGKLLWEHSMIERFGRLTFPNGRTGCVIIEGPNAIIRGITSYWGAQGPARDRFYAFDKRTGEPVWSSTPGTAPKDSSFSTPVVEARDGRRVFYAGTGCGNIVCVNARNGEPIWRWRVSFGGVNSSPVLYKNKLINIHGRENLDTTEVGRMFAIELPTDLDSTGAVYDEALGGAPALPNSVEAWRNTLSMFTSSPTLVGDRLYQLTATGILACVNADTGEILWEKKLAPDNIHSSPLAVDGKLIIPVHEGSVFIIKPSDEGYEVLHEFKLDGICLGQPTVWNGHLYIHSSEKLYCWKMETGEITGGEWPDPEIPAVGEPATLASIPGDVLLQPGNEQSFRLISRDANGFVSGDVDSAEWAKFIPPTAKVKTEMDAAFNDAGALVAADGAKTSAGAFKGLSGELAGILRGRIMANLPFSEDFESYELNEDHATEGVKFAYPPLPWIGARFKWEIRDEGGTKVMAKTLDRILFQRATTFIGHPDSSNYTFEIDVMTDGNRRIKGDVGVINQRYAIVLKGGQRSLEVTSNHERIKEAVPFNFEPNKWYTLKTRVDVAEDGSGVVRGKAWERGTDEPEAWTIEVKHNNAHKKGAPGIFGFSPQSQKRVFADNIKITPN